VTSSGDEERSLAGRWRQLDRDTLADARVLARQGVRFSRLHFLRAPLAFLRALCVKRSFLDGPAGLSRAWMSAVHSFVTSVRLWSLEHDAEGVEEPHEKLPQPARIVVHRTARWTVLIQPEWEDRLAALDLPEAVVRAPEAAGLKGRGRLGVLEVEGERLLCKRMQHGGLLAKVLGGRYLDRRKPMNELRIACYALACGVPVAEVPAVLMRRTPPPFYQYWVVSRELSDTVDMLAFLRTRPQRSERIPAIRAAARSVCAMHDAGLFHADLNLKNILIRVGATGRPETFLIDFDKAAFRPHMSAHVRFRNLRRLWKSAEKARAAGFAISRSDMFCFLAEYAGADFSRYRELIRHASAMRWNRWRYRHEVLTTRPQ